MPESARHPIDELGPRSTLSRLRGGSAAHPTAPAGVWTRIEPAVTAALLFLFFVVPLWFSRGTFLINWDSVQFALGVERFDLSAHQPHPPGYIGYEVLGGWIARLTGDVPAALTLLSVVSAALSPAFLYLLARRMMPTSYALAGAVLFGFSPLLWHYGSVALTYAPEVALSLPFILLVHRASEGGRAVELFAAALVFALLGSVRQSALIMLAPLWLLAIHPYARRTQAMASGVLVGVCLAWAVPLVQGSGGLVAYFREAADLAGLAVARTAFATASIAGLLQNLGILGVGLVVGLHATLLLLWVAARRTPRGSLGVLSRSDRRFLLVWVTVPMLFFLGIHTGQPGYALLVMPPAFIWVGSALHAVVHGAAGPRTFEPRRRLARLAGGLSVAGLLTVLLLPEAAYRVAASEPAATLQQKLGVRTPADLTGEGVSLADQSPLATALRQYSIPRSDAYWESMLEFIGAFPEEGTAVLAGIGGPIASGSFRQLGYYLPEHRVYGVGWDRRGSFGYLFQTRHRVSDYSVRGLERASSVLALPPTVRVLIVPDGDVAGLIDRSSLETERWDLAGGASVTVARVPDGSVLEMGNDSLRARIRLRERFRRTELAGSAGKDGATSEAPLPGLADPPTMPGPPISDLTMPGPPARPHSRTPRPRRRCGGGSSRLRTHRTATRSSRAR